MDDGVRDFRPQRACATRDRGRRDRHRRDPGRRAASTAPSATRSWRPTSATSPVEHDFDPSRAPSEHRGRRVSDHPQDLSLREQARRDRRRRARRDRVARGHAVPHRGARRSELNSIVDSFASESAQMLNEAPEGPLHGVPVAVKDMFALPWRAPRDGAARNLTGLRRRRVGRLPAPARCGRGGRRRDQHARVRRGIDRPHLGLRPVRQPLGPGALRRRVVGWLGRRGRGAARGRSGRHRRWRVDPLPGRLLRRHRPEAHLGPRAVRGLHARVLVDERARAAVPGRGRRAPARRGAVGRPLEARRATTPAAGHRPRLLGRRRPRGRTSAAGPRSTRCARRA